MAKDKMALIGDERLIFARKIGEAAFSPTGENRRKQFIDQLVEESKWGNIAMIAEDPRYAAKFELELKELKEKNGAVLEPYLLAERQQVAAMAKDRESVAGLRDEKRANTARVAESAATGGPEAKQKLINELVDSKEWGQLAYLLVSPGKRFDIEIANISALLPPDISKYIEFEATNLAEGEYTVALASRDKEVKTAAGKLEELNGFKEAATKDADKYEQEELANIANPQIAQKQSLLNERIEARSELRKAIMEEDPTLTLEALKQINGTINGMRKIEKSTAKQIKEVGGNKDMNDVEKSDLMTQLDAGNKDAIKTRKALEAAKLKLDPLTKEIRALKTEVDQLVAQDEAKPDYKRIKEEAAKFRSVAAFGAEEGVALAKAKLENAEKARSEFKDAEKTFVNTSSQKAVNAGLEVAKEYGTSLSYLAEKGRIKEATTYLYNGAGRDDAVLRTTFLSMIADDSRKLEQMTAAVAGLGNGAKEAFVKDLIASDMLDGLTNRLEKLGMNKEEVARVQLMDAGKVELAYNILKGSKEGLKTFALSAQKHVQNYDDLQGYYDSFDDKGEASKALGTILAYAQTSKFGDLIRAIDAPLRDPDASVELKVNIASVLSDAHKAIEARDAYTRDGKEDKVEKSRRQGVLDELYTRRCALDGDNALGVILENYSQKGIYNALKVAAYEAGKNMVGGAYDSVGADIAGAILYAPNLASFGKTKDILDKALAKEGIGEKLSIGDKIRAFFAPLLALLDVMPDPKQLMDVAAYMTGLKRGAPKEVGNVEEVKGLISANAAGKEQMGRS